MGHLLSKGSQRSTVNRVLVLRLSYKLSAKITQSGFFLYILQIFFFCGRLSFPANQNTSDPLSKASDLIQGPMVRAHSLDRILYPDWLDIYPYSMYLFIIPTQNTEHLSVEGLKNNNNFETSQQFVYI